MEVEEQTDVGGEANDNTVKKSGPYNEEEKQKNLNNEEPTVLKVTKFPIPKIDGPRVQLVFIPVVLFGKFEKRS